MRYLAGAALLALSGFAACGGDDGAAAPHGTVDAGTEGGVDAAADADAAPGCGTAGPTLSAGTELAFDDGTPHADIRHQTAAVTIDGTEYKLAEAPLWEAVRFELAHPAKVLGFRVQWANVDAAAAPDMKLEAGLYGDFGYNGFDFWAPDPLWTGTRCVSDMTDGQWLDYALPEPVVIDEPGLVYVAHHALTPTDPVFYYDDSAADNCDAFDSCRSAFNLPEVPGYYNGTSFPFQRDFLVRLVVEYTDDVKPADKLFQEVPTETGDHVSWADYDGDGFDDALVSGKLLKNDGGTFTDVTQSAGLAGVSATGGVFGDYDNDGCLDLFLFSESPANGDTLMRSKCDGTFEDVTAASKITDLQSYEDCGDAANVHAPSAAAAWLDLDADGYLDLYVANFICWSKETYYVDTVFHNEKDGTFSEWTGTHGFSSNKAPSRGAAPADADGDGDIDLFVNAYRLRPNYFFVNDGSGNVTESGQTTGLAGVATQAGVVVYFGHTIGAAWGDLDNDGDFDLIAANLAHPRFFNFSDKTQVLINDGSGHFTDKAGTWEKPVSAAGLRYQETHSVPALADFDQDGVLDMVITAIYDGRPTDFYWGKGDGTFELDAYHAGITTKNGWGVATADYDNDGDEDVFATKLFRNDAPGKGHWLQVRVNGNVSANRAAIGASVLVEGGGKKWLRQVQGGTGKGGQDSLTLHFGLGAVTSVDTITITFPGGKQVKFSGPIAVDQRLWLAEDGSQKSGMSPP